MEIETTQLTRKFGHKTAISGLDLRLPQGVYGLLGENGAGKSTLMRILATIDRQTSGEVSFDGMDVFKMNDEYRAMIGYIPQDFSVFPSFTAFEFVQYIGALKGLTKKDLNRRVREVLEFVNLTDVADKKVRTFSGGMKRRVGIAQAIINNPAILILDEPTAGLDPIERIRFSNIISEMGSDCVILFSTHIISDIEAITDNVILLKGGTIRKQGKVQELLTAVAGQVFELAMDANDLPGIKQGMRIVRIRQEGDLVNVRYLGNQMPGAKPCVAALEDYYIYLCEEIGDSASGRADE